MDDNKTAPTTKSRVKNLAEVADNTTTTATTPVQTAKASDVQPHPTNTPPVNAAPASTPTTPRPAPAPGPDLVLVFDPSAPNELDPKSGELVKRVHEQVVEKVRRQFQFSYGVGTPVPRAVGNMFLAKGFRVTEMTLEGREGLEIKPAPENPDLHATDRFILTTNQVVAEYDELTLEALLKRANSRPGGDRFTRNSGREDIIDFLLSLRRKAEAELRAARNDGVGGDDAEDMSAEELARVAMLNAA